MLQFLQLLVKYLTVSMEVQWFMPSTPIKNWENPHMGRDYMLKLTQKHQGQFVSYVKDGLVIVDAPEDEKIMWAFAGEGVKHTFPKVAEVGLKLHEDMEVTYAGGDSVFSEWRTSKDGEQYFYITFPLFFARRHNGGVRSILVFRSKNGVKLSVVMQRRVVHPDGRVNHPTNIVRYFIMDDGNIWRRRHGKAVLVGKYDDHENSQYSLRKLPREIWPVVNQLRNARPKIIGEGQAKSWLTGDGTLTTIKMDENTYHVGNALKVWGYEETSPWYQQMRLSYTMEWELGNRVVNEMSDLAVEPF